MAKHLRDLDKRQSWQQHLQQQPRSGLSIRAYCRQHHLAEPSFYFWRRTLAPHAPAATAPPDTPSSAPPPFFLPLRLTEPPPPAAAVVELVLRGGRLLRIPPGFAPDALRTLLALLEQLPC